MFKDTDIAYLAGLVDGEGSLVIFKDNRTKNTLNVHVTMNMVDKETIERIGAMFRWISGDQVPVRDKIPLSGFSRRLQYVVNVNSKRGCLLVLEAITPYLITKKLQSELIMQILRRSTAVKKYRCTALDYATMVVIKKLKKADDCGEARAEALQLLGQVTPNQSSFGPTVLVGGEEAGVETRDLTPKNNDPQERPALSLRVLP